MGTDWTSQYVGARDNFHYSMEATAWVFYAPILNYAYRYQLLV